MEVTLTKSQHAVLSSDEPIVAFAAGIATGKSFTLAHFVLQEVVANPGVPGLVVANVFSQLLNATAPAITGVLSEAGIQYELVMSGARKRIVFLGTTVFLYSLEQYDNIRGIEVGFLAVDEAAFTRREAVNVCFGRLRHKGGSLKARLFSSPKSFNWFYEFTRQKNVKLITGRTKDNPNLPEQYYTQLLELYGGENSKLARQELFGEFVNLTSGAVYYAFDRQRHVKALKYNDMLPIYIGADFNVQKMSYVAMQYTPSGFKVLEAVTLADANSNTFSMAQELWSKYGTRALIVPDSTANSRKTSAEAGVTDIRILKNMGLNVLDSYNGLIKNRHNNVNMAFHKGRLEINETCGNLIKEIETLTYEETEGDVSHLAVAMGYVVTKLEPIKLQGRENLTNPFLRKS